MTALLLLLVAILFYRIGHRKGLKKGQRIGCLEGINFMLRRIE